jgi:hypothetical protein
MDSDRKSAVSSFYGGKNSFDALNSDFPRGNVDLLSSGHPNSAGYNQGSFFDAGRQEPLKGGRDEEADVGLNQDDAWDVYADFNNVGPRYSTAFGQNDAGYRQIPLPDKKGDNDADSTLGPVEMVTVPALGPEWKASEMRNMTKAGKREQKADTRRRMWQGWRRDEYGICGGWLTRKVLVFTLFGLCVVIGIVLAFTIPRVPGFSFNDSTPLTTASGSFNTSIPAQFSRAPANFTFPAYAALRVDTNSNFLPLSFSRISAEIYDLDTNMQVASGNMGHHTVPANVFAKLNLPLNFTYVASNDSDPTWTNWHEACKNKIQDVGGVRPGVNFRLLLNMRIIGLPSSYSASTQVTGAPCPIELPSNSV